MEFLFYGTGRQLSKFVKQILYKKQAEKVLVENYLHIYEIKDRKVNKKQAKKVIFVNASKDLEELLKKHNLFEKLI